MPPVLSRFARLLLLSEVSPVWIDVIDSQRQWTHQINLRREELGEFNNLYKELRNCSERFFEYLRMSAETFDKLLHKLEPTLQRMQLNYRKSITAEERLVVTLRFLATGMSFRSLAFAFRMGKTTVASIVKDTTEAIWDLLREECLPFPDEKMWRSIADNMYLKTNFPNCIGSIDGKHIRIKCPNESGSDYFNYKHYYSIVLQAVADSDCKFVAVDVGCKGRQSDGGVFRSSKLFELLETNRLNIPPPTELPNSLIKVPFVLVGDEAYPLLTYLMRPFPRKSLDNSKHVFNYRLTRCRQKVECAFGILTAKWQILRKAIETTPNTAIAIVRAVCVLHNFVIINEGIDSHSLNLNNQPTDRTEYNSKSYNAYSTTAKSIRYKFTQYFNSREGELPWQNQYALPGNVLRNAT